MMNFIFRVVLLLVGLVFAASLAVAALLLVGVWMVRLGWAKLTGKPVTPWTVMFGNRFDPRAGFDRFRTATERQRTPSGGDVAAARARGESVKSPTVNLGRGVIDDITDVRPRPATGRD